MMQDNKPARCRAVTDHEERQALQNSLYRRRWTILFILAVAIVAVLIGTCAKAAELAQMRSEVEALKLELRESAKQLSPAQAHGYRANVLAWKLHHDSKARADRLAGAVQWDRLALESELRAFIDACAAAHTNKDDSVLEPCSSSWPAADGDEQPPASFDTLQADAAFTPTGPAASAPLDFEQRDFIAEYMRKVNSRLSVEDAEALANACMKLAGQGTCSRGSDPLYWCALIQAESTFRLWIRNRIGCSGAFQINYPVHESRLRKLGLDIFNSFEDQVTFAELLYSERGFKPWLDSKPNTTTYYGQLTQLWEKRGE